MSEYDVIIVGSGAAGLTAAIALADHCKVLVLAKGELTGGSTAWAQGGIAAVLDAGDTFENHIEDTMVAGAGLNRRETVEFVVENAPHAIERLVEMGVPFNKDAEALHLTREGGHSHRRIVHVDDATGWAVQAALLKTAEAHPNITLLPGQRLHRPDHRAARGALFGIGPRVGRLCARRKKRQGARACRPRDDPGKRRGGARVSILDRSQRRDRRRHRDGMARRRAGQQHGDDAVPPDLPL